MTPERAAGLVVRWTRFYTRDLPAAISQRRVEEIAADLHDHIAHERAHGTEERRIALSILSRMIRGLSADASWRWRFRPSKGSLVKPLLAVLAAALGSAAVVLGEADDSPGLQLLGALFVIGAITFGVRTALRSR
ncbi:hypothetical protein [Actinocorallia libanotica]|uniref:Peptidase M48 domain-containing protein n=1 Tax=Actinocorallia libanotica TaxID=46162 RepID=A0ABN1RML4_9ACTN